MDYEKKLPVLRPNIHLELHPFRFTETTKNNPFIDEIERTGMEPVFT